MQAKELKTKIRALDRKINKARVVMREGKQELETTIYQLGTVQYGPVGSICSYRKNGAIFQAKIVRFDLDTFNNEPLCIVESGQYEACINLSDLVSKGEN